MTTREMRERRGKLAHDMAELASNLTAENKVKFDLLDKEQGELKTQIEAIERSEALEVELRGSKRPPERQIGEDPNSEEDRKKHQAKVHRAWLNYLKHGLFPDQHNFLGISEEERNLLMTLRTPMNVEQRDMGEGNIPGTGGGAYPGSTQGFFVPVGFTYKIEEALKFYGNMWNVAEILDTATGQLLPYPTDNDTTVSGELVGEGALVSNQDVSLSQIILAAYKFSTKMVKVSIELLQDSAFDMESFLIKKFATRLGRITNSKFTVGAGPSATAGSPPAAAPEPYGIISEATACSATPVGDDNALTPDPTTQVGYIDLVNLEHCVDPLYRPGAKFMFHDTTLRYIKTLKDKYGRPLWMAGMTAGAADTILGYGYSINNDMAQLAHSAKSVAFGRLDKYIIRRVKDMTVLRLTERFADYGQVAFLGFARYDGRLLDAGTHPVKYFQNS